MPTITKATDTGRKLPAKDNWPEKVIWDVEVLDGGINRTASMLVEPAKGEPSGEVVLTEKDGRTVAYFPRAGGGAKSKDFKADPVKLKDENRRSALHCAANIAPEGTSSQDILKVAQNFYEWIVADD